VDGLTRCVELRPALVWPRLMRGYAYMERAASLKDRDPASAQRDFDLARQDFKDVLDQKDLDAPATYVALVNGGVLWLHQGKWDEASADFRSAIELSPGGPAAYLNLALTYLQHGQAVNAKERGGLATQARRARAREIWKTGVAALDEAIKQRPEMSRLYRERGRLRLLSGESAGAREDFVKAVTLSVLVDRTLVDDLVQLGRQLYDENDYAGAALTYQAMLAVTENHRDQYAPQRALVNFLLAQPLLQFGPQYDPKAAARALDAFLETVPLRGGTPLNAEIARDALRAYKARGLVYLEAQDFRSAIDAYSLGLKISRDPELLELRGWAFLKSQAPHLASLDFDESLAKQPTSGAHLGKADACVKLGQNDAAAQEAEKGLTVGPQTELSYYRAARVFAQIAGRGAVGGEPQGRARALLRQALLLVPPMQREGFWDVYVKNDDAFKPILGFLQDLNDEVVKPRR
jgi:tetratricopeptide (TPR) repeat protein